MIIIKKKAELLRFGLFVAIAAGLLLYVMAKSGDWERAEAPGREAIPTAAPGALPDGLPGQLDMDGESYFAEHRIMREQLAAAQREEYQALLSDDRTDPETRKVVQMRFLTLGEQEAKAKRAEQLIKALGYTDAAVTITEESVTVVVKAEKVTQADFVQIVELVSRTTGLQADRVSVRSRSK